MQQINPVSVFTAPTMVQLGRRVLFGVGLTSLVLMVFWLWFTWGTVQRSQFQRMSVGGTLIAGHFENYLNFVGADLDRLGDDLMRAKALRNPSQALSILNEFKRRHPDVVGATVILPDGQIAASTELDKNASPPNVLANPDWREDFYNNLKASGLSVNRTQLSYLTHKWIIPIRYTVRDSRGRVVFLLQTAIFVDKQQNLWRNLKFAENAAVGLLRTDGYLISRYSAVAKATSENYQGKVGGALFQAIQKNADAGTYMGTTVDGSTRYGYYQRLKHYPLYAFLSYPKSTFIAMWWQGVRLPVFMILGVLFASIVLYRVLAGRFARRMRFVQQSMQDTGVSLATPCSSGVSEIDQLCVALSKSQQKLEQATQNREKLLLSAAEAGTYAVRVRDSQITAVDARFLDMVGKTQTEVLHHSWASLLFDDISDQHEAVTGEYHLHDMARSILRFKHKDGHLLWLSLAEYHDKVDGESIRYGLAIDVSDRERLLNTVRLHSNRFQALWQLATNRAKSDDEKTQLMLRLAMDSLDMDTVWVSESVEEWVILRQVADTLGLFHQGMEFLRSDALCQIAFSAKKSIYVSDLAVNEQMHTHPIVVQMGLHGYASVPIWMGEHIFGTLVFLKREPLLAGFNKDDQAFMELLAAWLGQTLVQRQQREILESMAMTDSLTRLLNRRAAEIRFNEEIARAKRTGEIFSIAICDLDRFKLINDHYGHAVGDEVLRQVASIMKSALRDGDWMARWGGEEFIVYLHHSDSEQAYVAMDRLRLAINTNPLTTREGGLRITASIGIGVLHSGEGDIARVLSEADGCLYEAKRSGRDRVVVSAHVGHGTLWTAGMLQHALQENRIIPSYQIMVDLKTHEVVADEALARLVQPDGSLIVANDFIEAAEGINLVHAVDQVITRKAMQRCAAEREKNSKSKAILHFVNLSPQFLARKDLIQELLKNSEDDRPQRNVGDSSTNSIVFEITERQFISDFDQLRSDLKPLMDQGFRLALDDFGSGYSSFLYLAELPISFLKIEGWMVQNMRHNPRVLSMVQSIVVLAQKQGITTIAECIEDLETAEMLRDMGVDWGQGFYFGRPECEMP